MTHTQFTSSMMSAGLLVLCGLTACGQDVAPDGQDAASWQDLEAPASTPDKSVPMTSPEDPEPVDPITPMPEPAAPDFYEMSGNVPQPLHAGSFERIVRGDDHACVIDEFERLFCWEFEGGEGVGYIKPIAYNVKDVALDWEKVCVTIDLGRSSSVQCRARKGTEFQTVMSFATHMELHHLSVGYYGAVCVVTNDRVACDYMDIELRVHNVVDRDDWVPYAFEYDAFSFNDYVLGRVETLCALEKAEGVVCWSWIGGIYDLGRVDTMRVRVPQRGNEPFTQMRHTQFGEFAALAGDHVEIFRIDSWGDEDWSTKYVGEVKGTYTKLYSGRCGQSVEGPVMCWRGVDAVWPVLEQTPRDLSIAGNRMCAITLEGQIKCGDL